MDIFPVAYLLLAAAAFMAGAMDAVVGGGGLIQIPALFSVFPQSVPATLLGTNKLSGILGTAFAARAYAKRIHIDWSIALPTAAAAFLFSFLGAKAVMVFPHALVRQALPFILLMVATYVFLHKDLGVVHSPRQYGHRQKWLAFGLGAGIGFYDGFLGPGTGSFLIFLFVRVFCFDFLRASATAKVVNVACNLSALLLFGFTGHILWLLGLLMAVCNIAGSVVGARLALTRGSSFIRRVFLLVFGALIIKTAVNAFC